MADRRIMTGKFQGNIPIHEAFVEGDSLFDPLGNDIGFQASVTTKPFYLSAAFLGTPEPNSTVFLHTMTETIRFPVNFVGSQIKCMTPPSAETIFTIAKNGNAIGTVSFTTGNGVITVAGETVFDVGDVLSVIAPSALNGIANLSFNFMGFGLSAPAAGMTTFILEPKNITANAFRLEWTAVEGATAYKIYKGGVLVATVEAPTNFYNYGSLTASTSYTMTVGVVVGGIEQPQVPQPGLVVVTLASPVAVPTTLTAPLIAPDVFRVTWPAVSGATAYKVYVNGLPPVVTMNTYYDKFFLTRTGKTPGNQYTVSVTSLNGTSESALSNPLTINTTDLADVSGSQTYIMAISGDTIGLAWRENIWATRYELQCGIHSFSISAGQSSYYITGLTPSTTYPIEIQFWNNDTLLDTDSLSATTLANAQKIKFFPTASTIAWTPPASATSLNIKMWGAGGSYSASGSTSGKGGYSEISGYANNNKPLFISVGFVSQIAGCNAYGGGGGGGNGSVAGIAGGGYSAIYTNNGALLMVAGGGGGAGGSAWNGTGNGGNGGGITGGAGGIGYGSYAGAGGAGGTQNAPGNGGGGYGSAGNAGLGYCGGTGGIGYNGYYGSGGGGGGGYRGGGGGGGGIISGGVSSNGGGGGGGSGYVKIGYTGATKIADTATDADTDRGTAGNAAQNGLVVIWW